MSLFKPTYLRNSMQLIYNELQRDKALVAAEIGVYQAEHVCSWVTPNLSNKTFNFKELILVDNTKDSTCLRYIKSFTDSYPIAKFLNIASVEAAAQFTDEYFDFIYIDSAHWYKDTVEDLNAWQNKVKKGGFIAGHDYDKNPTFDVNRAVDEFAGMKNVIVTKLHTEFCIKRTW